MYHLTTLDFRHYAQFLDQKTFLFYSKDLLVKFKSLEYHNTKYDMRRVVLPIHGIIDIHLEGQL